MAEGTSEHLRVSSSSSTAVKYTVSSRTREPARLVTILRHIFRIVVAFYTILATIAKLHLTFSSEIDESIEMLLDVTFMHGYLQLIVDDTQWWALCITSLLTLYLCVKRDYTGWWTHLCPKLNLTAFRGKPARSARPWCADFDKLFIFLPEPHDYLHSHHTDPGHCDTRSFQGLRGALFSSHHSDRCDRSRGSLPGE